MAQISLINWTDATQNAVLGCEKISPGCAFCYACRECRRMAGNPNEAVARANRGLTRRQDNGALNWTGVVRTLPERLAVPFRWPRPKRIFVNSLSDLFHRDVPDEFIRRQFAVMRAAAWHTFQVLTKRADRLEELAPHLEWPGNVWQGVSVENADYAFRVHHLRRTPAKVKFVSVEPLLGPISRLDLSGIDWVITGGESGPRARPFDPAWALGIRDQCRAQGVLFFHKQNGGRGRGKNDRVLDGRTYDEMPPVEPVAVPPKRERDRLAAELVPESVGVGRRQT